MYIFKKNMLCLFMKCIYNINYINTCKYFQKYTVCVRIYIDNKYTQYTHILCKQKRLFWMFDSTNKYIFFWGGGGIIEIYIFI